MSQPEDAIRAKLLASALERSSKIDFLLETAFPGATRPNKLLGLQFTPEDVPKAAQYKRYLEIAAQPSLRFSSKEREFLSRDDVVSQSCFKIYETPVAEIS